MTVIVFKKGPQFSNVRLHARTAGAPILDANAISDTAIAVDWQLPDQSAADQVRFQRSLDYEIIFDEDTGVGTEVGTWTEFDSVNVTTSGGQIIDTGRAPGTDYFYRAISEIFGSDPQTSPPSDVVSAATTNTTPTLGVPTNILVTVFDRDALSASWDGNWSAVSGATGYEYAFVPQGGTPTFIPQVGTSVICYVIARLAGDVGYTLQVRAVNASGPGPLGTSALFNVAGNLKPPNLVSATVIGSGPTGDVELRWVDDIDADTMDKVEVERSTNGASFANIGEVDPGAAQPQFTDNNPGVGSQAYQVRARDDDTVDRFSTFSAPRTGLISTPPAGGWAHFRDFTTLDPVTWQSQLTGSGYSSAGFGNQVLFDPGDYILDHTGQPSGLGPAMMYAWDVRATDCKDQVANMVFRWGGHEEVWIYYEVAKSTNWDIRNANCGANPDYKFYEAWIRPGNGTGLDRFEAKQIGGSGGNLLAWGDLIPLATHAPTAAYSKSSPINANSLADGQRHVHKLHFHMFQEGGVYKSIVQRMVDNTLIVSVKDIGNTTRVAGSKFTEMHLGHNRNLGVSGLPLISGVPSRQFIHVFTHGIATPVQGNPGWFDGLGIADWADNGGAIYIP